MEITRDPNATDTDYPRAVEAMTPLLERIYARKAVTPVAVTSQIPSTAVLHENPDVVVHWAPGDTKAVVRAAGDGGGPAATHILDDDVAAWLHAELIEG